MSGLEATNDSFHDAFQAARGAARERAPIFVILQDQLVACQSERTEHTFTPPSFHTTKSVAHAPVALFALLLGHDDGPMAADAEARLRGFEERLVRAEVEVQALGFDDFEASEKKDLGLALSLTLSFVRDTLEEGAVSRRGLEAFARTSGPLLERLTLLATRRQLDALHACVERVVAELDDVARASFHVIVTGDHQARQRSLAMQYFEWRLGDAAVTRLAYGEGITTVDEALELAGTRLVDAAMARAFFGDETRLQRDVLGDVAEELLAGWKSGPLRRRA